MVNFPKNVYQPFFDRMFIGSCHFIREDSGWFLVALLSRDFRLVQRDPDRVSHGGETDPALPHPGGAGHSEGVFLGHARWHCYVRGIPREC